MEDLEAAIRAKRAAVQQAESDLAARRYELADLYRRMADQLSSGTAMPSNPFQAPPAAAPGAPGERKRPGRVAQPPVDPDTLEGEELRKEYRRRWHHASKEGPEAVDAFKEEWNRLYGRGARKPQQT